MHTPRHPISSDNSPAKASLDGLKSSINARSKSFYSSSESLLSQSGILTLINR